MPKIVQGMAYNRTAFKDKITEYLAGALIEFYTARLAEKNRQTKWVKHWYSEADRLLSKSLVWAYTHQISGFQDRDKATAEAFTYYHEKNLNFQRRAEIAFVKYYPRAKLSVKLTQQDTDDFWKKVSEAIDEGKMLLREGLV